MGCPCAPAHGICGRSQRPAFPAPSLAERGTTKLQNSGETMSRECASTLPRHCEQSDPSPLAAQASLGRQSAKALLRAGGSNPASFRKKAGLLHRTLLATTAEDAHCINSA